MDVVKAVQGYVLKMVDDLRGMKVLLLDVDTTSIVSLVATQSQLLAKECYLIDRIDNKNRDRMRHLKCVCFLRPTAQSIQWLVEELRNPCYGDYYLHFSNTLKKSTIERLAEVDEHEVVREVQEYFGDYMAINSDLFSLNLHPPQYQLYSESLATWNANTLERTVQGLSAALLSLKKKPVIRYERNSALCQKLAAELRYHIQQEGQLYDFRRADTPPILLILDRRNDPVTPLLTQWIYQAMVHELIGIHNGRVDMSNVPDIQSELKEIVLSADQDPFFKKCMYLNLGDLGANIKAYVDKYQNKTKSNMHIESIADMKRFVEEYPEFRKLSGNVSKHVAVVGELSRKVTQYHLLEVSELEQSLANSEHHGDDLKHLQQLIATPAVPEETKLRLVMLYALRYEKSPNNATRSLKDLLAKNGVSDRRSSVIDAVIRYAGEKQRQDDLFSNQSFLSRGRSALKGLKGVENVYTQHTPHLAETIEQLLKNRLRDTSFPFIDGGEVTREKPQDVIIFMVGGTTFEEAKYIAQLNATTPGTRFVLGGTCVHNSTSFLTDVVNADNLIRGIV
ncbi:hypothetical protein BZG36_02705 [Bifiguratus adelaidae]|uniref:Vacuolar protein sorting-associated protein 45 n=1 Tax=Bifiguratus adelaidae TaxID=1938954 RepID=A0A261Y1T2_9FUNG|nr:hypothetical protein BZG36_02705 [Bifiguratus adelaidae]